MNILAMDMGKFNSMCCIVDSETQVRRFQSAGTTRNCLAAFEEPRERIWW